jgi:DNA-binding transcriptional regulator YhcF (GntR family)
MRYRFSDQVQQVLGQAQVEAAALGHDYVGTEHLLLALIRGDTGPATAVLRRAKVDTGAVRRELERSVRRGHVKVDRVGGELPYTSRAKKSLEYTLGESRGMRHDQIGTEHLLIGLILEEKGIAAQVLRNHGLDEARARALAFASAAETGAADEPEAGVVFGITIDDTSTVSIYEQIIAQVREAVAVGRLSPGARLPPVRQLADALDIAPGTVARAYGELERLGVVVTEGARGTRVADREGSTLAAADRVATLVGLLRPVVVAAFHLGATSAEVRASLEPAMTGIFPATGRGEE